MFHNNLWATPLAVRLVAVGATHVQMWRSLTPREAPFVLVLRGQPADGPRGRLLGDRRHPRGQPVLLEELLPVQRRLPGRTAVHPDVRRRGPGQVVSALARPAVHPDPALGLGRHRRPVLHPERVRPSRDPAPSAGPPALRPVARPHRLGHRAVHHHLRVEPAVAPQPDVRPDDARSEPAAVCRLAADRRLCVLLILVFVEEQIAPPRPGSWSLAKRLVSYLQWLALPVVGLIFSTLPALNGQRA